MGMQTHTDLCAGLVEMSNDQKITNGSKIKELSISKEEREREEKGKLTT